MSLFRAKATLKNLIESNGKMSMGKAMLKAGYSADSANNPGQLVRSKTWRKLVDEYLPEDKVLQKLQENALQKRSIHGSNAAIDMILKVRGKYQKDKSNEDEQKKTLDELEEENKQLKAAIAARRKQARVVS